MTHYRFSAASPVDEITTIAAPNGAVRAYLHAGKAASAEQIEAIKKLAEAKDWQAIPTTYQGKPALELRRFAANGLFSKDEDRDAPLLKALKESNFTAGDPVVSKPKEEKSSWSDVLKKRSLQAAGAFYTAGDYYFVRYGLKEGKAEEALAGVAYGLGTQSLLWFGGNNQSDLQVAEAARKLEQYLEKQHLNMSEQCSLHSITHDHDKGLITSAHDVFRRFPSEMFAVFTGIAGSLVALGAARHRLLAPASSHVDAKSALSSKIVGWGDVGLGTTTLLSSMIGGLVEERKPDPDEPKPVGLVQNAKAFVQQHPLSVMGGGLMVSTLFHAASTAYDWFDAKRIGDLKRMESVPMRGIFVATNIIAEILTMMSSKGHGKGVTSDESVNESVMAVAAEMIAKQPEADREQAFAAVCTFLSHPDALAKSAQEVEKELRLRVQQQLGNPWACHASQEVSVIPQQKASWVDRVESGSGHGVPPHADSLSMGA